MQVMQLQSLLKCEPEHATVCFEINGTVYAINSFEGAEVKNYIDDTGCVIGEVITLSTMPIRQDYEQ